jgi:hypothetical protein
MTQKSMVGDSLTKVDTPNGRCCRICGGSLRSSREREAQTCGYHLDVKTTAPSWNGRSAST